MGPLHLAAAQGQAGLVQVLLDAGAPVDALDGDGQTALLVREFQNFLKPVCEGSTGAVVNAPTEMATYSESRTLLRI